MFLALLTLGVVIVNADIALHERAALVDIYQECGGRWWESQSGWLHGDPCANRWYGVSCDPQNSTVLGIDLNPVNTVNILDCKLPPSIGNLTNIEKIYLSSGLAPSYIHGHLPETIQNLHRLRCFYVSHSWIKVCCIVFKFRIKVIGCLFSPHIRLGTYSCIFQ
jgi:hypothetical protein